MTVKRTPSVLQMEAAECGAAALSMILGYHGRFEPLEELRGLCGISRDGAKALNIIKAGRQFGMKAKGMKAEPEALEGLGFPLIAFVNFNHFLVVEGVRKGEVYLNDPASGHRRESLDDFSRSFTGVALTFTPGDGFEKADRRPSLAASLAARLSDYRIALLYVFLLSLALVVPGIAGPFLTQIFIDYVLVRELESWLWPLLGGMVALAALRFALIAAQSIALTRLGGEMRQRTGYALLDHMLRLPIGFFEQRFTGEIADRVRLNEGLVELLSDELIGATINVLLAIFYLIVLFVFSVHLTLVILLLTSLNVVVLFLTSAVISEKYRKVSIEQGKMMGARIAGLKDIETYKASGGEALLFERWAGLQANVTGTLQEAAGVRAWTGPLPAFISMLILITTLAGGGYLVMSGVFSLGELVAYQSLALTFSAPVTALAAFGAELQQVRTFTNRLDDTLDQAQDSAFDEASVRELEAVPRGRLTLREASFGYNPLEPPLIDRLSFDIAPGQRIALVGPSGSGKSTVGKMIGGLVELQSGAVLIDGRERREWLREALAARLAYVRQDVILFSGTVRENLTLWDASITDDDMVAAARDAAIHEAILRWPGGYDMKLSSGASNVSGGERQRLEIARALATNPTVIILDEATSALDPVTEHRVMEAIRRRGLTCIVIAHRLSTIRDCDEIIVLDGGQILERGDHASLLEAGGTYKRLVEA